MEGRVGQPRRSVSHHSADLKLTEQQTHDGLGPDTHNEARNQNAKISGCCLAALLIPTENKALEKLRSL